MGMLRSLRTRKLCRSQSSTRALRPLRTRKPLLCNCRIPSTRQRPTKSPGHAPNVPHRTPTTNLHARNAVLVDRRGLLGSPWRINSPSCRTNGNAPLVLSQSTFLSMCVLPVKRLGKVRMMVHQVSQRPEARLHSRSPLERARPHRMPSPYRLAHHRLEPQRRLLLSSRLGRHRRVASLR